MNNLEQYKTYLQNIQRSLCYYNYLRPLFNFLEKANIDFFAISKDQLAQYSADKKYSENAFNNLIKACRDYCRYKQVTIHPAFEIKLIKPPTRVIEYLTLEEIEKSIRYISTYNGSLNSDKIAVLLYFMFYTGVRKSEILNLKRTSFDMEKCLVKIYEEKTKQEKIIPFPHKLKTKLEKFFYSEEENENAFNVSLAQIDYLFRNLMRKYLGKNVKPHLTRHGAGRYLQRQGVPATVVQKMFGHKSILTTLRYIEPDQKMIEETYREKIG